MPSGRLRTVRTEWAIRPLKAVCMVGLCPEVVGGATAVSLCKTRIEMQR